MITGKLKLVVILFSTKIQETAWIFLADNSKCHRQLRKHMPHNVFQASQTDIILLLQYAQS